MDCTVLSRDEHATSHAATSRIPQLARMLGECQEKHTVHGLNRKYQEMGLRPLSPLFPSPPLPFIFQIPLFYLVRTSRSALLITCFQLPFNYGPSGIVPTILSPHSQPFYLSNLLQYASLTITHPLPPNRLPTLLPHTRPITTPICPIIKTLLSSKVGRQRPFLPTVRSPLCGCLTFQCHADNTADLNNHASSTHKGSTFDIVAERRVSPQQGCSTNAQSWTNPSSVDRRGHE
jgi:hypothetical protein